MKRPGTGSCALCGCNNQPPQPLTVTPQAWLNGPERLQGGWWDGDYVRRDYYIARLESGRRAWLFRNAEGQWFIHGWFG